MFSVVLMTTVISTACKPNTDIATSCVCLRISLLIRSDDGWCHTEVSANVDDT